MDKPTDLLIVNSNNERQIFTEIANSLTSRVLENFWLNRMCIIFIVEDLGNGNYQCISEEKHISRELGEPNVRLNTTEYKGKVVTFRIGSIDTFYNDYYYLTELRTDSGDLDVVVKHVGDSDAMSNNCGGDSRRATHYYVEAEKRRALQKERYSLVRGKLVVVDGVHVAEAAPVTYKRTNLVTNVTRFLKNIEDKVPMDNFDHSIIIPVRRTLSGYEAILPTYRSTDSNTVKNIKKFSYYGKTATPHYYFGFGMIDKGNLEEYGIYTNDLSNCREIFKGEYYAGYDGVYIHFLPSDVRQCPDIKIEHSDIMIRRDELKSSISAIIAANKKELVLLKRKLGIQSYLILSIFSNEPKENLANYENITNPTYYTFKKLSGIGNLTLGYNGGNLDFSVDSETSSNEYGSNVIHKRGKIKVCIKYKED